MPEVEAKQVSIINAGPTALFHLEHTPKPRSLRVYVNGVEHHETAYTVHSKTIRLRVKVRHCDEVLVDYRY